MLNPVRVHVFPLAIAAILFVTAVPVEIGMGTLRTGWPPAGDLIGNVLLFLPLGAALARHRLLAVAAIAFALSCTIELIQLWSIDRFTSPFDVAANTVGGFAGAVLWRRLGHSTQATLQVVTLGRTAQAALAASCAAIVAAWLQPGISTAVAGWDPTYALLIGNERTGDRSWEGDVEGVALVPEAIGAAAARRLASTAPAQWRGVVPAATLLDTAPHRLQPSASVQLPQEAAREFAARASAANAFTIAARVKPASLEQSGPARIVSFSLNPYRRNVDLGQEGERLVFRVRTPASGENGARLRAVSEAVLQDRTMTLVASYDGAVSRVYVDGRLAARRSLAAAACRVRALCDGGAHFAWTIFGASAVVLAVAMLRVRSTASTWGIGVGAGAVLGAIVLALAGDARLVPAPWTAVLPLASALAAVTAIQWAAKAAIAAPTFDRA